VTKQIGILIIFLNPYVYKQKFKVLTNPVFLQQMWFT